MMKKLLTVIMILWATVAWAQSEVKLPKAEREYLNLFFSNFSEAYMESFQLGAISDQALLEFGLRHNYINNRKALPISKEKSTALISSALVDQATDRFLGVKIKKHKQDTYAVPLADGEAYTFSQITKMVDAGNGLFQAQGVIYSSGPGNTPNPNGTAESWKKAGQEVTTVGAFSALIKKGPSDWQRYILLEYKVKQ